MFRYRFIIDPILGYYIMFDDEGLVASLLWLLLKNVSRCLWLCDFLPMRMKPE